MVSIQFGCPWSGVNKIDVSLVNDGPKQSSLYRNGLHQAQIRVALTLVDNHLITLNDGNSPDIADVINSITLMDATVSENGEYTMPGRAAVRNSSYSQVTVGYTANDFNTPISTGNASTSNLQDNPDAKIVNGIAYIYYYITFQDKKPFFSNTMIGMTIEPKYIYGTAEEYNLVVDFAVSPSPDGIPATTASTSIIKAINRIIYNTSYLNNVSINTNAGNNQNNTGPYSPSDKDPIENYRRLWSYDISFQGNNPLKGAYIDEALFPKDTDGNILPVNSETFAIYNVRSGLFQSKLYAWPANTFILPQDELDSDAIDIANPAPAPTTSIVTLNGIPPIPMPQVLPASVRLTLAVGFGDANTNIYTFKNINLLLVDIYGNSGAFHINTKGIPSIANLLSTLPDWSPLLDGQAEDTDSPPPATEGSMNYIIAGSPADSGTGPTTDLALMWAYNVGSGVISYCNGYPASLGGTQSFALNAAQSPSATVAARLDSTTPYNNVLCYRMQTSHNSEMIYSCTVNTKAVSSNNSNMVTGVTDIKSADYLVFKPHWQMGAALIFATADSTNFKNMQCWYWDINNDTSGGFPGTLVFGKALTSTTADSYHIWTFSATPST